MLFIWVVSVAPASRSAEDGLTKCYAEQFERVVTNAESAGATAVMRSQIYPAGAPPLHLHTREDEAWTVSSGVVRFWFGGRTLSSYETIDVESGCYVFGPRFVPHTFQTVTPTSEVIITNSPGAGEGYFTGIGEATEREDSTRGDLFEKYGLQIFVDQVPDH